ncbi:hypothetical protein F511_29253 [Dorcoceras hygrometricum]|uniref:Uncharacterized protein n=1 Tax=Dorcoceras hygrometricum TaxID=472368 RepID=A0A2Z7AYA5_9LAMI|nr:hypothetical protein F511_29253 [Dorcoceras hygrometricum]
MRRNGLCRPCVYISLPQFKCRSSAAYKCSVQVPMHIQAYSTRIRFKISSKELAQSTSERKVCLLMVWMRCLYGPRGQSSNTLALDNKNRAKLVKDKPVRPREGRLGEEKTGSGYLVKLDEATGRMISVRSLTSSRESDISLIKDKAGISDKFEVIIPEVEDRAHRPPRGFHTFYEFRLSFSKSPVNLYLDELIQVKRLGPGKFYISNKTEFGFIGGNPSSHKSPVMLALIDLFLVVDGVGKAEMMKAMKEKKSKDEDFSGADSPPSSGKGKRKALPTTGEGSQKRQGKSPAREISGGGGDPGCDAQTRGSQRIGLKRLNWKDERANALIGSCISFQGLNYRTVDTNNIEEMNSRKGCPTRTQAGSSRDWNNSEERFPHQLRIEHQIRPGKSSVQGRTTQTHLIRSQITDFHVTAQNYKIDGAEDLYINNDERKRRTKYVKLRADFSSEPNRFQIIASDLNSYVFQVIQQSRLKTIDPKRPNKKNDRKVLVAEESNRTLADSDSESTSSSSSSESEQKEVHCLMANQTTDYEVFDFSNSEFTREDLINTLNEMIHEYRKLSQTFEEIKAENNGLENSSAEPSTAHLGESDSLQTELSKLKIENDSLRARSCELSSENERLNHVMSSSTKSSVSLSKLHEIQKPLNDKSSLGFIFGESSSEETCIQSDLAGDKFKKMNFSKPV